MKQRCYNKNNNAYIHYGGRGITICKEWLDKENGILNFYNWSIKNGHSDDLTIDRINVNGNYEPSNCRWVDAKTQQNNKTNNLYFTYHNENLTLAEICEKYNLTYDTTWKRLYVHGWSIERAINETKHNN